MAEVGAAGVSSGQGCHLRRLCAQRPSGRGVGRRQRSADTDTPAPPRRWVRWLPCCLAHWHPLKCLPLQRVQADRPATPAEGSSSNSNPLWKLGQALGVGGQQKDGGKLSTLLTVRGPGLPAAGGGGRAVWWGRLLSLRLPRLLRLPCMAVVSLPCLQPCVWCPWGRRLRRCLLGPVPWPWSLASQAPPGHC